MKRLLLAMLIAAAILFTPTGAHAADPAPPPTTLTPTEGVTIVSESGVSAATPKLAKGDGLYQTTATTYCKRAWVNNRAYSSIFQTLLYTWQIWTSWCYNGSTVSSVQTGQVLIGAASTTQWFGVQSTSKYGFGYGYRHWEQAAWCSSAPWVGCIEYAYPQSNLDVFSNGTYSWWTRG